MLARFSGLVVGWLALSLFACVLGCVVAIIGGITSSDFTKEIGVNMVLVGLAGFGIYFIVSQYISPFLNAGASHSEPTDKGEKGSKT